jgi:hypothetical protein
MNSLNFKYKGKTLDSIDVGVEAYLVKDDDLYVVYVPAFNLVTNNKNEAVAMKNMKDSITLFLNYWHKRGFEKKLVELGWKQLQSELIPRKMTIDPYSIEIPSYLLEKVPVNKSHQIYKVAIAN